MCCDIILLILGIVVLVKGQVLLTRTKEVRGTPARIIGVILLLPLPLSFFAGLLLGALLVSQGKPVNESEIQGIVPFLGPAIIALCLFAAIAIAIAYAQPVRKQGVDADIEAVDVPERYHEHFQAEGDARPAPRSDGPEVTDQLPRPSAHPEDDRIRD
jgi:hypothetical protein